MTNDTNIAITISRQMGSGGAYLGQRLSKRLGALYMDREILHKAAEKLKLPLEHLETRDEAVTPLWKAVLESFACEIARVGYVIPPYRTPSDIELYSVESEIIRQAAAECPVVIVGHGGCHVLREHPRHLSVLLHADIEFRRQRVQELYQAPEQEARKMIDETDKRRTQYRLTLTGDSGIDARLYTLCIDTGEVGLETAEKLICEAIQSRFGGL